jgi:Fe2+ transport system protein FeoA
MQVEANKDREGQNVSVGKKQGTRNQKWTIAYTDQEDPMKKKTEEEFGFRFGRPFYIVSQMCSGIAIRVNGRNLVLSRKSNNASMHFFFDQKTRTIKSW